MKKLLFIIFFLCTASPLFAKHVAGGELFYEWLSTSGTSNQYRITLRLFRDCNSTGPPLQGETVIVGIYENTSLFKSLPLPLIGTVSELNLNTTAFPCLVGNVNVCYQVAVYSAITDLPINAAGFTLARSGCCRIDNISNLSQALNVGSTYVTKIPGTSTLPSGHNSSPQFSLKDTALVCSNKNFQLDFSADDLADHDILTYSFCEAYTAPNSGGGTSSPPTQTLNLQALPYKGSFSGSSPLGSGVTINPTTGIISGIAPGTVGQYVVNVCITEWRNGVAFTEHRKDFILNVQDCDFADADLPEKIIQCDNFTVNFQNQSNSSSIISYAWNFGDGNLSTQPSIVHTYADTGRYKATLAITGPNGCTGIDSTIVIVYPGFTPNFNYTGSCYQTPFHFVDLTATAYGTVNSWKWDFGDGGSSNSKNTSHLYAVPATVDVKLFVTSSKGCEKTISKSVLVRDKPDLQLPFKDTLICSIDTLPLIANGIGTFSWSPNINIINPNSSGPLVFPSDTVTYYVTLTDQTCFAKDSIKVNVLNFIKVNAGLDSAICKTDSFRLHPTSHALGYLWTASTGETVAPIKYPLVKPLSDTKYYVKANLGKCEDRDSITIRPVPYPVSNAGLDSSICFGSKAFLHGSIVGSTFNWSPVSNMLNANTLNPIAAPANTTKYILTSKDTLGCPKPVSDTVEINVIKPVVVFAGNDTSIVVNQPLQLNAICNFDNNTVFKWTPSTGLSNTNVPNPIAILNLAVDSIKYKVRATIPETCYGEDEITVRLYKTDPDIFVPTGFTPNGDGKNDILKPIPVGVNKLEFFSIYNRWGQLIYTTAEIGKGWNGLLGDAQQPSGTYVYMAQGVDYTGKTISKKGTVVLIR